MSTATAVISASTSVRFWVPGVAAPGGSKKVFPRKGGGPPIVTDDAKNNREWKAIVAMAARAAYDGPLLEGPLHVRFTFVITRPDGHYGKRGLLPSARPHPTIRPDVLKLSRSTEDALKEILWHDDSQTVQLVAVKRYGERGEQAGCWIEVTPQL
jgi:Holliday junction resolvase RusA-like endonuclease